MDTTKGGDLFKWTYRKNIPLPEPPLAVNDVRPECASCQYAQHGVTCHDKGGSCLYLDMKEIEDRHRSTHVKESQKDNGTIW